ncbi:nucleotidyl transferase AbiEii/AbiGii toxin family protein [Zhongshania sp.]|jgi:predicted nucleotidyltransferase|uniref:nucleotidyl transferase AbiEii/AbiGii toxin family protein n=1 Tax=Zhongshania sp. TaxID=1971902 RepID=UPI001B672A99|nr:nucleotidyl transferase AbiEii/AbiGii toxin family protein [Zhongshania sp.]MBQ0795084.1 nucleotidyl transferase AbiEii/AbiGii toxin family protein [Zhongshania sp.]
MSNISLDISKKIDSAAKALFAALASITTELGIPYIVVGATARDLVLHHGYGASIERATSDVDFGVQVSNWQDFEHLKSRLIEQDFQPTAAHHRLLSPQGQAIDIIPFGPIENTNAEVTWPPTGAVLMNVLGFQEACQHADIIRVQQNPSIDIPVVTPAGMALLKLIAWLDRPANLRGKDAKDLQYLLSNYERIPSVSDSLFTEQTVLDHFDWDLSLAAAHQLGRDTQSIASDACHTVISDLFNGKQPKRNIDQLTENMCNTVDREFARNRELLHAFNKGFTRNAK